MPHTIVKLETADLLTTWNALTGLDKFPAGRVQLKVARIIEAMKSPARTLDEQQRDLHDECATPDGSKIEPEKRHEHRTRERALYSGLTELSVELLTEAELESVADKVGQVPGRLAFLLPFVMVSPTE